MFNLTNSFFSITTSNIFKKRRKWGGLVVETEPMNNHVRQILIYILNL